ncbi:MAG: tetratricopeptide repeat protein, partial [Acidobacteria bacterium]|nr:tetratricopeptide repeat protein [Acidobacteriota bacterium]
LPSLALSAPEPGSAAPAPGPAPTLPHLVEAPVTRTREEGEVTLVLGWQEGEDPEIVRGCVILLDFWRRGAADFSMLSPMRRSRFLDETVGAFKSETQAESRPLTWAEARRLLLEALDVNRWRGVEPDADYTRHRPLIEARLLAIPDDAEARAAVAAEDERAAREGDRPYMAGDLEPDELVATWLGIWSFGDYGAAYDLLADDHPLRRELTRAAYIEQRRRWADEAQPGAMRLMLVREQEQRASALWVPGAAGAVAPGGRRELEAFWSLVLRDSSLAGTASELPFATLSSAETGRRWFWTAYTVERDRASAAWRIARIRDEGLASQGLTIEELHQRVADAHAVADKITAEPPPESSGEGAEEALRRLTGALAGAMHYRDALIARLPLDEALYRASVADAQVLGSYERAAALLERMRGRFPGQARLDYDLGIQYYLAGEQIGRQGDAEAQQAWFRRATETLRRAAEADPSGEHEQALGEVLARQGHYTQAIAALRRAIGLDPARASAHADLADALMASVSGENLDEPTPPGGTDETRIREAARAALAALREAARLDANLHGLYTRMGAIYDVLGQHDDALLAFQEAVRHDPGDAEAHYTLGTLLLSRGDVPRALPELESAAQLAPLTPAIRLNLAAAYLAADRWRDAERQLDTVDRIRPGLPQVAELRSRVARQKKQAGR